MHAGRSVSFDRSTLCNYSVSFNLWYTCYYYFYSVRIFVFFCVKTQEFAIANSRDVSRIYKGKCILSIIRLRGLSACSSFYRVLGIHEVHN